MKGVLAAEAVRGIATMYQNYLNKAEGVGVLRLEPPDLVSVPPLRVYTHVQVARKITVRDVVGEEPAAVKKLRDKANAKAKANAEKPAPVADDDDDGEGEEGEEDEEEGGMQECADISSSKKRRKPKKEPKAKAQKAQKTAPASSSSEPASKKPRVA
jgi:hypothetical protein